MIAFLLSLPIWILALLLLTVAVGAIGRTNLLLQELIEYNRAITGLFHPLEDEIAQFMTIDRTNEKIH